MRRALAALAAAAMLSAPMAALPSETLAQEQRGNGLVVVQIGNIKDVVDVNDVADVTAAANLIVQACDLADVNAAANVIAVLTLIDQENNSFTFCKAESGPVKARNDNGGINNRNG